MNAKKSLVGGGVLVATMSVASPASTRSDEMSAADYFVTNVMVTPQPYSTTVTSSAADPTAPSAVDQFIERVLLGRTATGSAVEIGLEGSPSDEGSYSEPDLRFMFGSAR